MDLVTLNVLRHVFETLQTCQRMTRLADGSTISNLKQFCNKLVAKCCESEKKLSLMTEKNVDDFYAQRMTREVFAEIIYTKVKMLANVVSFSDLLQNFRLLNMAFKLLVIRIYCIVFMVGDSILH